MGCILVVEDDADVRDVLRETLAEEGYEVVCAENGAEGMALLRGSRPFLVLLDLLMPVMNGHEFRARQLADPRVRDIPVVVLTASTFPAPEGIDATAFLKKPVDLDLLLETVQRFANQ